MMKPNSDYNLVHSEIVKLLVDFNITHATFTRNQLAEAFTQALGCGDFVANIEYPAVDPEHDAIWRGPAHPTTEQAQIIKERAAIIYEPARLVQTLRRQCQNQESKS